MNKLFESKIARSIDRQDAEPAGLIVAHDPEWTRSLQQVTRRRVSAAPQPEDRLAEPKTYDMD